MKKYLLLAFISIALVGSAYFLYVIYTGRTTNEISCHGNLNVYRNDADYAVVLDYIFHDNQTGIVMIEGYSTKDNQKKEFISRRVNFTYTKENKNYILTSKDIIILTGDNIPREKSTIPSNLLSNYFSSFFLLENTSYHVDIHEQYDDGLIFSVQNAPYLYCERNE